MPALVDAFLAWKHREELGARAGPVPEPAEALPAHDWFTVAAIRDTGTYRMPYSPISDAITQGSSATRA